MEAKILIFYILALLQRKVHSALSIQECSSGVINVTEDTDVTLTCGQYSKWIWWYSSSDSQLRDYIGDCSDTSCSTTGNNKSSIIVKRISQNPTTYQSNLIIRNATRRETGFFHCIGFSSEDKASCRLRITASARLIPENCNVWISNWKVQGTCHVAKMYSSDSIYKCTWSVNDAELPSGFEEGLTKWTDSRTYMRGNCSFRQDMPPNMGSYTYKISVDPGLQNIIVKTINIEPPEKPEINCPETVLEGSTVTCVCISPNTGNPPANFLWDGLNADNLLLHTVQRQNSLTNYTCRQTWGPYGLINSTVNYTLTVSYGPSGIYINSSTENTSEESKKTILVCTAIDVYPSAVFRWNISCDDETHNVNTSTCILSTARFWDELTVECTANNQIFENVSSSGRHFLNVTSNKEKDSNGITNSVQGGIIGGVVAAVIIIAVIATVIVVYITKRRKNPVYDTARRPANNEHNYVDLALNTCKGGQPTGASYDTVTRRDGDEHGYVGFTHRGQNASESAATK